MKHYEELLRELAEIEQWTGTRWDEPGADVVKPLPKVLDCVRRVLEHPAMARIAEQSRSPYLSPGFWGELEIVVEHGKRKGMGPCVLPLAEHGHNKTVYLHCHFPETEVVFWATLYMDFAPGKTGGAELYTDDIEEVFQVLEWAVSDVSEMPQIASEGFFLDQVWKNIIAAQEATP